MGAQRRCLTRKAEGSIEGGAVVERLMLRNTWCLVEEQELEVSSSERETTAPVRVSQHSFLQENVRDATLSGTAAMGGRGGARPRFERMVHKGGLCPCRASLCFCGCLSVGLLGDGKDQFSCQGVCNGRCELHLVAVCVSKLPFWQRLESANPVKEKVCEG